MKTTKIVGDDGVAEGCSRHKTHSHNTIYKFQVAQIPSAGNLYQQSAAAWSLRLLALFDLAAGKAEGGGAEVQGVVHR